MDGEQLHAAAAAATSSPSAAAASLATTTTTVTSNSTDFESSALHVDSAASSTSSTETIDFSTIGGGRMESKGEQVKAVSKSLSRKQDHQQNLTTVDADEITTVVRQVATTTPAARSFHFATQTAEAEEVEELSSAVDGNKAVSGINTPFPDDFPRPDDLIISQADDPLQMGSGSGELIADDDSLEKDGIDGFTRRRNNNSLRLLEQLVATNRPRGSSTQAPEVIGINLFFECFQPMSR